MDDHSVVPSHPSPVSSVTLTPTSSHDLSTKDTPTSLPLPPIDPADEAALLATSPTLTANSAQEFPNTPPSTARSQGKYFFYSKLKLVQARLL